MGGGAGVGARVGARVGVRVGVKIIVVGERSCRGWSLAALAGGGGGSGPCRRSNGWGWVGVIDIMVGSCRGIDAVSSEVPILLAMAGPSRMITSYWRGEF